MKLTDFGKENVMQKIRRFIVIVILSIPIAAYPDSTRKSEGKLELRIVPQSVISSFSGFHLDWDTEQRYKKDLTDNGPNAGRKRNDEYIWLETDKLSLAGIPIKSEYESKTYILVCNTKQTAMIRDGSWGLKKVYVTKDNMEKPAIGLEFDESGSELFSELTTTYRGNALAIIIDGEIYSAPQIRTAIRGQGIIAGNFTQQEAEQIAENLQKGIISRDIKKIRGLVANRYMLKSRLADCEQAQSLPNIEAKIAEYKEKLEQIKKSEAEPISAEAGKKNQEEWDAFKEKHGNDWQKVYSSVRAAVSQLVVAEAKNTDIAPWASYLERGSILQLWESGLKTYSQKTKDDDIEEHLNKIIEKYNAPPAVIEHAKRDSKKELYLFGYEYLIQLLSKEQFQQLQKELEAAENELEKYPGWQDIEKDLLGFMR